MYVQPPGVTGCFGAEYHSCVCFTSGNGGVLRRRIPFMCMEAGRKADFLFLRKAIGMKIVTIKASLLQAFEEDPEVLRKTTRPCVLVVRLKYRERNRSFAVPMRSNISPSTPPDQYFPLPPRPTARPGHHHGLHFTVSFLFWILWPERRIMFVRPRNACVLVQNVFPFSFSRSSFSFSASFLSLSLFVFSKFLLSFF